MIKCRLEHGIRLLILAMIAVTITNQSSLRAPYILTHALAFLYRFHDMVEIFIEISNFPTLTIKVNWALGNHYIECIRIMKMLKLIVFTFDIKLNYAHEHVNSEAPFFRAGNDLDRVLNISI